MGVLVVVRGALSRDPSRVAETTRLRRPDGSREPVVPMTEPRKLLAEMLGTFLLVFIGTTAIVGTGGLGGGFPFLGQVGIALAFGLALLAGVYAFGGISGAHFNPAVTVAMWWSKKIGSKDAGSYIAAQLVGALLASGALFLIMRGAVGYTPVGNELGASGYGTLQVTSALLSEVVLTFLFLTVIFNVTCREAPPGFAGLAIGIALVGIHLAGIPLSGASVNPARSLGPSIVSAVLGSTTSIAVVWVYIVGPVVGGLVAAVTYRWMHPDCK